MQARYMVIGTGRDRAAFGPETWSFVLDMARGVFDRAWRDPLTDEITPAPPVLSRLGDVAAGQDGGHQRTCRSALHPGRVSTARCGDPRCGTPRAGRHRAPAAARAIGGSRRRAPRIARVRA